MMAGGHHDREEVTSRSHETLSTFHEPPWQTQRECDVVQSVVVVELAR